jgi:hypothetical protein
LIPSSIATSLEPYMAKYVKLVLKWITDCVIAVRIFGEILSSRRKFYMFTEIVS